MDEQADEEDGVEEGPDAVAAARQRPAQRGHNFESVIQMSRHSPAAGQQQLGRFLHSGRALVFDFHEQRRLAPQAALAVARPEQLLLVIHAVIHTNAHQTCQIE